MELVQRQGKTKMLKTLLTIFVVSLAVGLLGQFAGGQGTQDDPWQIGRPEDLNRIRDYIGAAHNNKYYVQTHDIDLGVAPWNTEQGWEPIGSSATNSFQGHYDGAGCKISNLTINRNTGSYHALFGYVVGANIVNVGLENVNISGSNYVAGLIGRQEGESLVRYCYVTGSIKGANYVGGFVSYMNAETAQVFDCYSVAMIECTAQTAIFYAGGIISYQYAGETRRCYAAGPMYSLVASSNAGGVIGNLRAGSVYSDIHWNTDIANVERGIGNVANSPGQQTVQLIRRETFTGFDFTDDWAIEEDESYPFLRWEGDEPPRHCVPSALPPTGLNGVGNNRTVNLRWTSPPADFGFPDGYNVYRDGLRINEELVELNQYEDTELTNWVQYNYYVTSMFGESESFPSKNIVVAPLNFSAGEGTPDDPYIVSNAEELNGVRYVLSAHFKQTRNIDLGVAPWNEGAGWKQIGESSTRFTGHYDGDFFIIDNLTIDRAETTGLFGSVDGGAYLKNINLRNVDVRSTGQIGALIGWAYTTTIECCSAEGSVSGGSNVGGLIGRTNGSTVRYCYTKGSVTGTSSWIGGVVGQYVGTTLTDSYSRASVRGNQNDTGGLQGLHFNGTTSRCYSTGEVTAAHAAPNWETIGGLLGRLYGGTLTNCFWDTETSTRLTSQGGDGVQARETGEMIYPYRDTYADWDFENIWVHDVNRNFNNGYPYLFFEDAPPQIVLDAPEVKISIVTVENRKYSRLTWEPVEEAVSYRVFSSDDPYSEDWGEPIAHTEERVYNDLIEGRAKYYHVIATTDAAP